MPKRLTPYWHPETTCWGPQTEERCQMAQLFLQSCNTVCQHPDAPTDCGVGDTRDWRIQQPIWCPAKKDKLEGEK